MNFKNTSITNNIFSKDPKREEEFINLMGTDDAELDYDDPSEDIAELTDYRTRYKDYYAGPYSRYY